MPEYVWVPGVYGLSPQLGSAEPPAHRDGDVLPLTQTDARGFEEVLRVLQLHGQVEPPLCVGEFLGLGDGVADQGVHVP
jgi:hypothetical protein